MRNGLKTSVEELPNASAVTQREDGLILRIYFAELRTALRLCSIKLARQVYLTPIEVHQCKHDNNEDSEKKRESLSHSSMVAPPSLSHHIPLCYHDGTSNLTVSI